MKNTIKILMLATLSLVVFSSCERVAPNYAGVLMENWGKDGKDDFTIRTGRVWTFSPGTLCSHWAKLWLNSAKNICCIA